ncbi:MAG: MFS transporter [Promethearchaeota archaeon]|nr:MAG: MFS transporter [Candidatus Lokiarchaeota archaeon]
MNRLSPLTNYIFLKVIKICFFALDVEKKRNNFRIVYYLAAVGDFNMVMLVLLSIIYGTNKGLSTVEIGLIGGAYGFAYIFMPAILGNMSDKFTRKSSLISATTGQMIITLIFFFIIQVQEFLFYGLFFCLFLYGVVYGFFWPSIEAFISEHTEHSPKQHEKAIAYFCIAWSIGYSLGPLVGGYLSDINFILAFILAFILYATSFLLICFKLPSIKPKYYNNRKQNNNQYRDNEIKEVHGNKKTHANKKFIMLLMGVMIYGIISKVLLSYFTNYAALPDGLNWNGTLIGQVMFFFGLGRTSYFIIARFLKNSFAAITQSLLVISPCLLLLAFFEPPSIISFIFFIIGFFVGRSYLVSLELMLKYEQEKKGAKAGIFESSVGIGSALSPLIAGSIAIINLKLPFFIFAGFVLLLMVIHLLLRKKVSEGQIKTPD